MPLTEMVVMVAVFAAVVLSFIHVLRFLTGLVLHRTIRKAIDRDPDAAESIIARLGDPAEPRGGDDRTATLLIAFGIAMVVASLVIGDPDWIHYGIAGAVFPLIIGTALWLRHYALNRSRRTDSAEQQ